MTPSQVYQKKVDAEGLTHDQVQLKALGLLDAVHQQLLEKNQPRKSRWLSRRQVNTVKGVYMWGEVGRGKTLLMDCFFASLPFAQKRRQHFNRFMLETQAQLRQHTGIKDPLRHIAKEIAQTTYIICFDEFFVEDIADAMILGQLFTYLFDQGVCLVATSNCSPDMLYQGGLLRERFMPAIKVLEQRTQVFNLSQEIDYRDNKTTGGQSVRYYTPLKQEYQRLEPHFLSLSQGAAIDREAVVLNHRIFAVILRSDQVVWFDFSVICHEPAASADYIALCSQYKTVIISNVPQLSEAHDNSARRFISLVDEFYDNQIGLILSAAVPIDQLYSGRRLAFAFKRTKSRLIEMTGSMANHI